MIYPMTCVEMYRALLQKKLLKPCPHLGDLLIRCQIADKRDKPKRNARLERITSFSNASQTKENAGSSPENLLPPPSTLIDLLKAFREGFASRTKDRIFRAANKGAKRYRTQPPDFVTLRRLVAAHGFKKVYKWMDQYFQFSMRKQRGVSIGQFYSYVKKKTET